MNPLYVHQKRALYAGVRLIHCKGEQRPSFNKKVRLFQYSSIQFWLDWSLSKTEVIIIQKRCRWNKRMDVKDVWGCFMSLRENIIECKNEHAWWWLDFVKTQYMLQHFARVYLDFSLLHRIYLCDLCDIRISARYLNKCSLQTNESLCLNGASACQCQIFSLVLYSVYSV